MAGDVVDRRKRIAPTVDDTIAPAYRSHGFPGIGLLRVEFDGCIFCGTATIIADGKCLLTAAHMVVEYDTVKSTHTFATSAWFELRKNEVGTGSTLIRRYNVTNVVVYPKYIENPTSNSGFDLALCWIDVPETDHTISELHKSTGIPIPTSTITDITGEVAVVGFPGEHKEEKWGMAVQIPSDRKKDWTFSENKEILTYDFIDTSPGQVGSPIMHLGQKSCEIIGVNTGGSAILKKKWGTFITPAKLKWIVESLGSPWKISGNSYLAK